MELRNFIEAARRLDGNVRLPHVAGPVRGFSVVRLPEGLLEEIERLLEAEDARQPQPHEGATVPTPTAEPSRARFRGILDD